MHLKLLVNQRREDETRTVAQHHVIDEEVCLEVFSVTGRDGRTHDLLSNQSIH